MKGRGKEVQSDGCKVAQPKRIRLEHSVDAGITGMLGCQGGGLWNDYGACEQEYHNALLLTCQQHRMVVDFHSKTETQKVAARIPSMHISPCPTSFRPGPFGLKYLIVYTFAYVNI